MVQKRIAELKNTLDDDTAALIISAPNRFYFTNFNSSDGAVLIANDGAYLLTDSRYYEKAKSCVSSCEVILCTDRNSQLLDLLIKHGIKTVLVESSYISVAEFAVLKKSFKEIQVSSSDILDNAMKIMRSIKSPQEVEYIRRAQNLTDKTFSYIVERISEGRTEREVMLDMEFFMRGLGSEGVAFDFIVVSGKKSSLPHGVPGDKVIKKGDFVTMDFGAVHNGYRSDMTRTVAVGPISEKQQTVYNTVLKAQRAALDAISPGDKCSKIDSVARKIIYEAGYEGCFGHALGHSVGIEIHESPVFSPRSSDVLRPGNIMTVEPGIYIEGEFGVRIEDMIYITEQGSINLTESEKELIVL